MKRIFKGILGVPASLMLAFGIAAFPQSAAQGQPVPAGLGFNIHIMGNTRNWDAIKASGARFIRADYNWAVVEKKKGQYNFTAYDTMLRGLVAAGIRPIFILDYGNPLYPKPETSAAGRDAYARWAAASARHFKGRHVIWEIWNEPNVGFWKGIGGLNSPTFANEYVALVKKTVSAMRAANPHCYILGGAVSCLWKGSFKWLRQALKDGLLRTGINALSVHPYGFPRPELSINTHQPGSAPDEGFAILRQMMAKAGAPADFPVVASEVGYPTGKKITRGEQAMLFVRLYVVDQMCHVPLTIWYNWDTRDAAGFNVYNGRRPLLPIYRACQFMTAQLAGYHFVRRLKVGSRVDYVVLFEKAGKSKLIIAWTVPKGRNTRPDKARAQTLVIPTAGVKASVSVRNIFGKAVPAKASAGTITVKVTGSPLYITY